MVKGIDVYGVRNLRQTFEFNRGEMTLDANPGDLSAFFRPIKIMKSISAM
jgi:hypothetical protein